MRYIILIGILLPFVSTDLRAQRYSRGPERFLMSRAELKEWSRSRTAAESSAFLDRFWAQRDPTPGTIENELRAEFDRRVQLADGLFTTRRVRGAMSDRGRIFILLGEPASSGRRRNFNLNFGSGTLWWLYTKAELGDLVEDEGVCVFFEPAGDSWNLKPGPMLIRKLLDEARHRWSTERAIESTAPED